MSAINLQKLWIIKNMNFSEFYSSFTSFISLTSLLNNIPLTFFMLVILLKLPIQNSYHLLSKGTPCWNQQSSMTKIRQNGHLKKFWIYDIQDQTVVFSIKFTDLIVILILFNIIQIIMSFKTYLKFYINIMHNTLTNQIHNLLNWNWFIIN